MQKFKKRLANYGLTNSNGKNHVFRTTGKPCSCWLCSYHKYKETGEKKATYRDLKFNTDQSLFLS